MNEDQFSAMLAIIVPPIIEQITKNSNVDDNKAISRFYQSKLYQELSDEKSKLWHYSPMMLPDAESLPLPCKYLFRPSSSESSEDVRTG